MKKQDEMIRILDERLNDQEKKLSIRDSEVKDTLKELSQATKLLNESKESRAANENKRIEIKEKALYQTPKKKGLLARIFNK